VGSETASALLALWERLPVLDRWPAPSAILGYRGCWLQAPQGQRWLAYDGVVVNEDRTVTGAVAHGRRDAQRQFERAVLSTAPPGLLPDGIEL